MGRDRYFQTIGFVIFEPCQSLLRSVARAAIATGNPEQRSGMVHPQTARRIRAPSSACRQMSWHEKRGPAIAQNRS